MSRGATEFLKDVRARARNFLASRQQAYISVFGQKDDQMAKKVLKDLAKFCRANESTFNTNDRAHAVLEGRREVWLRIQKHLQLDTHQLFKIYGLGENE